MKKGKKRVRIIDALDRSKERIETPEFLKRARKRPQDFTRSRKMPFTLVVYFILNMIKASIQTCLDKFFENVGNGDVQMSQQSFCEARDKIKWSAFRELFKANVEHIYTYYYDTWRGYRLSAIDGSKAQIPDDNKLRCHFGTMGKDNSAATGQASLMYDMLNNVIIDAHLQPLRYDERTLALWHMDELRSLSPDSLECIIFDRGYASFDMLEDLTERKINYVMRVKKGFSKAVDEASEADGEVVLKRQGREDINVRVVKFALPSGEVETLITDLWDKELCIEEFKALYFLRWPVETKIDEIKNKLEVENFSGRTVNAVMQDFFVSMYMSNMIAIASWEAQERLDEEREGKENKYQYNVNVSNAIGAFKDRFIKAMLEPRPRVRSRKALRIILLMSKHPTPERPGRSNPRNKSPRKAKFRHNRKSNC